MEEQKFERIDPGFLKRHDSFISDINEDDATKRQKLEILKKEILDSIGDSVRLSIASENLRIDLIEKQDNIELAEKYYNQMKNEFGGVPLDKSLLLNLTIVHSAGRKVSVKSANGQANDMSLLEEARILYMLKGYEFICAYVDIATIRENPLVELKLIMESYECSLNDAIHGSKHKIEFTADQIIELILDIFLGIHQIHKMGIMHRDIKSGNILLKIQKNGKVFPYICDFGYAREKKYIEGDTQPNPNVKQDIENIGSLSLTSTFRVGTKEYSAPEILKKEKYTRKIDIFSASLVAWEIVHRKHPFSEIKTEEEFYQKIGVEGYRESIQITDPALKFLETLIPKCWNQDPALRPEANEVVKEIIEVIEVINTSKI